MDENIEIKILMTLSIMIFFTINGCQLSLSEDSEMDSRTYAISVEEAKKEFESSVMSFHISPPHKTRSTDEELLSVPLWDEAIVTHFEHRDLVEVPVDAPYLAIHPLRYAEDTLSKKRPDYINSSVKLLAEKDALGNVFFTLANITVDLSFFRKEKKKIKEASLGKIEDFSGCIRYYTLNGEFISGKKYEGGKAIADISLGHPADSKYVMTRYYIETCTTYYTVIDSYWCVDIYVNDELENHYCDLYDSWTIMERYCTIEYVQDGCPVCGQNPCVCHSSSSVCPVCGREYCICSSKFPDLDSIIPPPKSSIELMDKKKFAAWDNSNCLTLCKKILSNYGQTDVGSSDRVIRLVEETSSKEPRLSLCGINPLYTHELGIQCIDRHLEAGKVIIVGVDYKRGSSNPDGTDHFIVITGRGRDNGKDYYTFMDCATTNAGIGCDTKENRLYYNSLHPPISGRSSAYKSFLIFTVTHIRPNDGVYDETEPLIPKNSNNMKFNLLACIVLCLIFKMSVAHSQNEIKKIDVSKITHPYFSSISIHYAKTHFPFWLNKLKTYELVMEHEELRLPTICTWDTKDIDPKLPLCPPSDKDISKCETTIWGLYFTTNGDYFIGMANAWSSNHRDSRTLLVTFAFDGSVIDYVPFYECYNCYPNDLNVVDGSISSDLVVVTQSLHFENDIYPVTKDWQLKPNLKCQRIDRVYSITSEGKFNLKSETKFKPKVYTAEEIAGDKCIFMGDEEVLKE